MKNHSSPQVPAGYRCGTVVAAERHDFSIPLSKRTKEN
jgi:hypothetical protein